MGPRDGPGVFHGISGTFQDAPWVPEGFISSPGFSNECQGRFREFQGIPGDLRGHKVSRG